MNKETIFSGRGTKLRQNNSSILEVSINSKTLNNIYIINHTEFITQNQKPANLVIKPHHYYMIINRKNESINISYNKDISNHEILYDPYKYENSVKEDFNPNSFKLQYSIPDGYIDVLSKWYSIKFTYPTHNLIFLKPEMGISIQVHQKRSENWEILKGNPIIINGNKVHYFVKAHAKFNNGMRTYHSIINPNRNPEKFVLIKEEWGGKFDEDDITRVYNPNNYK